MTATDPIQARAVRARSRPPWTSRPSTGQARGRPLRGSRLAHRSPTLASGLTRFACPTSLNNKGKPVNTSPVLPGGI